MFLFFSSTSQPGRWSPGRVAAHQQSTLWPPWEALALASQRWTPRRSWTRPPDQSGKSEEYEHIQCKCKQVVVKPRRTRTYNGGDKGRRDPPHQEIFPRHIPEKLLVNVYAAGKTGPNNSIIESISQIRITMVNLKKACFLTSSASRSLAPSRRSGFFRSNWTQRLHS